MVTRLVLTPLLLPTRPLPGAGASFPPPSQALPAVTAALTLLHFRALGQLGDMEATLAPRELTACRTPRLALHQGSAPSLPSTVVSGSATWEALIQSWACLGGWGRLNLHSEGPWAGACGRRGVALSPRAS